MPATQVSGITAHPPALSTSPLPNEQPVSLLRLPPELRVIIYNYVLVAHRPILDPTHLPTLRGNTNHVFVKNKSITFPPELPALTGDNDVSSAILSTCKTIYSEAWPILYRQNIFVFTHPFWMVDFLSGRALRKYRKAVRQVKLEMDAQNAFYRLRNKTCLSRDKTQFDEMELVMADWQYLFDTWATHEYTGIENLVVNFLTYENVRSHGSRTFRWKSTATFWDMLTSLEISTMWERVKLVWVGGLTEDDALNRLMIKGDELAGKVELTIARIEKDGYEVVLYKNPSVPAAHKGPAHKFLESKIPAVLRYAVPRSRIAGSNTGC
ncbi:MAG: hypothetical protein M1835_006191 [Candelina submexicana]|nr:MAG: hypothetical protein M1835_006191 [Candelina submexicana]